MEKAHDGDVAAIKLCYQKFEDWCEKRKNEHTGKDGAPLINSPMLAAIVQMAAESKGAEYAETFKQALLDGISDK